MHMKSSDIDKIVGDSYKASETIKKIGHQSPAAKELAKDIFTIRNDLHAFHKDYDQPRNPMVAREVHDVEVDDHKFSVAFHFLTDAIVRLRRINPLSHELKLVHDYLKEIESVMDKYKHHVKHHNPPAKPARRPHIRPRTKHADGSDITEEHPLRHIGGHHKR